MGRGTETATAASATTGPCTTTTATGPAGPAGPGTTSVASSAASSAAAIGRSTSPEWETSPRRPPPRPRAESTSDSDQTPFSVIHGLIAQVHTPTLMYKVPPTTLLTVMVGAL